MAYSKICKCLAALSLILFIIVIICIIVIAVLAIKMSEQPSSSSGTPSCPTCPSGWLQHKGICYYFSTEERNWTSSQHFCTSHRASLPRIEEEQKDFVMRYKSKLPYWIGLTRVSGQSWKWLNGDNATLEVLGEGGNCAYLNDEVEGKASASRCNIEHHWICSRFAVLENPN